MSVVTVSQVFVDGERAVGELYFEPNKHIGIAAAIQRCWIVRCGIFVHTCVPYDDVSFRFTVTLIFRVLLLFFFYS